ncbi:small heat shock protein [Macrolepiota fuliginosa MF-IS2]|uniref:Small heat shock protein n=1 Tax=Macrolepiota fuliginosa MF-IS2 TaxID=1400762 RepID=A0A9P5XRX9_9AGAR|nr:small heat shock protein [Macrolepiota fuliginosa MF-IS2]
MASSIWFYEPFYDFDRFIDEALSNRLLAPGSNTRELQRTGKGEPCAVKALRPRMDLHEDSKNNTVSATFELPGLKKEDVNIDVQDGRLTVQGESKMSDEYEQNGWAVRERRFGKFSRTLQLPQGVKDDQIKANMENGILRVLFPKASPEAVSKKVTIE